MIQGKIMMTKLTHKFDIERRNGRHNAMLTLNFGDIETPNEVSLVSGNQARKIQQCIRQHLRNDDSVAQLDKNNFVVLLKSLCSPDNAEKVGNNLIENLTQSLSFMSERENKLNMSVEFDFVQQG